MSRTRAWFATAIWTWFVALIVWREWSRPALDQRQAMGAYVLLWIFGLCLFWPFVEEDE